MSFKWIYTLLFAILPVLAGAAELDKSKYITVDEIKPGDKAYCLTVYEGTKIEKFDLEVLSVIKNANPGIFNQGGRNTIMVMGLDERFKHTGPVQGCSGSPVYIDGRLAGALAVGFSLAKDPLYGVTPIQEMIENTTNPYIQKAYKNQNRSAEYSFNPMDLVEIGKDYLQNFKSTSNSQNLTIPLSCSLPASQTEPLNELLKDTGLRAYSAPAVSTNLDDLEVQIKPGATLASPLISGDISISAVGTATQVDGDQVFAFGHAFLGEGEINLPMSNGYIHTVVSNLSSSFKLGQAGKIIGSLKGDTYACVYGKIGEMPPLIDLNITVKKYNDYEKQYKCKSAVHPRLSPLLMNMAIMGAINLHSSPPAHHQITYDVIVKTKDHPDIKYSNFIADMGPGKPVYDLLGMLVTMMDNPYEKVQVKSIDITFNIDQANKLAIIDHLNISNTTVKPGQTVDLTIFMETYLKGKQKLQTEFTIPENIVPGQYQINVSGGSGYESFLRKTAPQKFNVNSLEQMFDFFNFSNSIRNDKIYLFMEIPAGGITLQSQPLPNLPATRSMLLVDPKRTEPVLPYRDWKVEKYDVDKFIINDSSITINIEK